MKTKKVLDIEYPHDSAFSLLKRLVPGYGSGTNVYQVKSIFLDMEQTLTTIHSVKEFCAKYVQLPDLHTFDIIIFTIRAYPLNYIKPEFIKDIKRIYVENDRSLPKFACINFSELSDDILEQQRKLFPDFFVDYRERPLDPLSFRQKWNKFVNS